MSKRERACYAQLPTFATLRLNNTVIQVELESGSYWPHLCYICLVRELNLELPRRIQKFNYFAITNVFDGAALVISIKHLFIFFECLTVYMSKGNLTIAVC